jgi:hypothetical protein
LRTGERLRPLAWTETGGSTRVPLSAPDPAARSSRRAGRFVAFRIALSSRAATAVNASRRRNRESDLLQHERDKARRPGGTANDSRLIITSGQPVDDNTAEPRIVAEIFEVDLVLELAPLAAGDGLRAYVVER